MHIDELLYHLHHPQAQHELDDDTLKALVEQYPYLDSIKQIYLKRNGISDIQNKSLSLDQKLSTLASNHYAQRMTSEVTYPPSFETSRPTKFNHSAPPITTTVKPSFIDVPNENKLKLKAALYPVEESTYLLFLKSLPNCKVIDGEAKINISSSESEETEHLIESSLSLKENIGSESLANLWAQQGKLELAINMYKKLSAEYPEKSSIFAAKIAKLKAKKSL